MDTTTFFTIRSNEFEFKEQIGQGGFGKVYKVTLERNDVAKNEISNK